jgi:arsenate reductase
MWHRYCKTSEVLSAGTPEMNKDRLVIYHNPNCSKSRETLQILEDHQLTPEIINYLDNPPSRQVLASIVEMLGISVRELIRDTETVYQDAGLDDDSLNDNELLEAISKFPALMQRPIVISGDRAVLGRPPARVLEIIA